ncbi:unnamed protein product [Meloidogyne enterolobii]|uniref:Uncharacterized protein n=2 Tax=Meloidogyne enterolobii TaxID=390850 RepID=A0ACB0XVT2_MELEN|nr:unnamed protein product [Meloidogyne enterolobii]
MALQKLIFVLIASLILINLSADAQNTFNLTIYDCKCAQNLCTKPCQSGKQACENCKTIDVPNQCTKQCKIN